MNQATRQAQYLEMRAAGKSNAEIAEYYGVSRQAVWGTLNRVSNPESPRGPKRARNFNDKGRLQCNKCDEWKPSGSYHRTPQTPTGFAYTCKACAYANIDSQSIEAQRRRIYIAGLEANGVDKEKAKLKAMKARFEERARWMLEYVKAAQTEE